MVEKLSRPFGESPRLIGRKCQELGHLTEMKRRLPGRYVIQPGNDFCDLRRSRNDAVLCTVLYQPGRAIRHGAVLRPDERSKPARETDASTETLSNLQEN